MPLLLRYVVVYIRVFVVK